MNDSQNWVEALNISPENLEEWSAQAPSGMPLLVWCLEQGHVSSSDYFTWASPHYALPVLESSFFSEGINRKAVESAKASGEWSAWMFPVDQWDSVTIVACVEPPAVEDRGNFVYVLANPVAMAEAWVTTAASAPVLPAVTAGDAPAGLTMDVPKPFKLNLGESYELPSHGESEPETNPVHQMPKRETIPAITPDEVPTGTRIAISPVAPPKPATAPVPPPPPIMEKQRSTPAAPPAVSATKLDDKTLLDALTTRYSGAMILRCQNGTAKPQMWSSSLQVSDATAAEVNLSYATFLRIVAKTLMPYHGYLVESPAHTEFFSALGLSDLPNCVTAVPVKRDGKLEAIVVAVGDEDNQKIESLHFAQEHVDDHYQLMSDAQARAS